MVSQRDNIACVSRSLATITAMQVRALLLLVNHLETRRVAACRESVQEIWEGGCSLEHQHEHCDPFHPKVTNEREATLNMAGPGMLWKSLGSIRSSGLFYFFVSP